MSKTHTIPAGTMATAFAQSAIAEATKAISNYSYFDPIDFLDDKVKSPALKERTLSYMAWKLDMTIINTARQLFWESYKDAQIDTTVDFEEFIVGFRGVVDQSTIFGSGKALNLAKLITMRSIWHSYAASASAHMNRDYKERELAEMIIQDDQRVQALDTSKIKLEAHEVAMGDIEMEKELFAAGVARAIKKAADRKATQLQLRPCVLATIDAARACHIDEPHFWELDTELQSEFTHAAIAAIKSAKEQLSTTASVTTSDYREIIVDAKDITYELTCIIDKKFADTTKAQSSIDAGREAEYKARKAAMAELVN